MFGNVRDVLTICFHVHTEVEDHGRRYDVVCQDCGEVVSANLQIFVKA